MTWLYMAATNLAVYCLQDLCHARGAIYFISKSLIMKLKKQCHFIKNLTFDPLNFVAIWHTSSYCVQKQMIGGGGGSND